MGSIIRETLREKGQEACPWCHADESGDYSMYGFTHPTDSERTATLSVYGGKIALEMTMPEDTEPNRLACEISFCPMCGRKFDDEGENGGTE